jgi:hypothetical protein
VYGKNHPQKLFAIVDGGMEIEARLTSLEYAGQPLKGLAVRERK